jgi:hypothetical protein
MQSVGLLKRLLNWGVMRANSKKPQSGVAWLEREKAYRASPTSETLENYLRVGTELFWGRN